LLGIDPADPQANTKAAALWPNDKVSQTPGINVADDRAAIVAFLQGVLKFQNVRPGADATVAVGGAAGQVTLAADVQVVGAPPPPAHISYLRSLPDIGFSLSNTKPDAPARCFFASDGRGHEVPLERLPLIV